MVFLFFFSSRRRHTRYIGDWSSDVCSSDLVSLCLAALCLAVTASMSRKNFFQDHKPGGGAVKLDKYPAERPQTSDTGRSEERRVGKECRYRRTRGKDRQIERGTDVASRSVE